jgi:D-alanyl-D-alanine carboxypeptidase
MATTGRARITKETERRAVVARPVFAKLSTTVFVVAVAVACSSAGSGRADPASPHRQLTRAIERDLAAHPAIPGEAVSVRTPDLDVQAARGYADTAGHVPLRVDTPFRIASVTKTFVAVSVLRLVEQHKVALDAPIARYLSADTLTALTGGGYDPARITVRELLDHTSGLFDYATSTAYDDMNVNDPGHHWSRSEQLRFAMDHGRPVAGPGRRYHYSDTNYILLGEILERASGQGLAGAVREAVGFERLGLHHTYWESLEAAPPGMRARAHQYFDTTFDNIALDASSDLYGGGGLVSTVGDLTRFYRALFDGRIFSDDTTLDAMLTVSKPGHPAGAGLGIFAAEIAGQRCWGHPGYWGTEAYFCPKLHLAFAIETNQADESKLDTTAVEKTIVALSRQAGE